MSDNIIEVRNLGKKYIINHQRERYTALRDVITNKFKNIGKKKLETGEQEEFWALTDVSFDIKQGDKVGIIGRNGAGKSTLLKLLSRITEPSAGSIRIKGRVASLLEVGTGFHPELTGRENIYLNGSILGMSMQEIKNKFDQIVEFAEVDKFLDTPVKRYSSGMYVRLAFSVAAHLEPEILIIDEVLAVGDAQFQKKCLGKMGEVSKQGRTVLFVSHNMGAIQQLCDKGILLNKGRVEAFSLDLDSLIKSYNSALQMSNHSSVWANCANLNNNSEVLPLRLSLTDKDGNELSGSIKNNDEAYIQIKLDIKALNPAYTFGYAIYNEEGNLLFWSYQTDQGMESWPVLKMGINTIRSKIPNRLLNEGVYRVQLIGGIHFVKWIFEPGSSPVNIYLSIQNGLSDSPYWMEKRPGIIAPVIKWESI